MQVVKPLYGIPEAGMHWFATYHKHHHEKLAMIQSTYDPYLLVTTSPDLFGLVGIQTDDTLFLADDKFAEQENKILHGAGFLAKPLIKLEIGQTVSFNGSKIKCRNNEII